MPGNHLYQKGHVVKHYLCDMRTILQINVTANWGSTGKIAEQIGRVIISNAADSYIAYSRIANQSSSSLLKIGNKISFFFHVILARFFDKAGLGSFYATKRLLSTITEIAPDIIHLHNIHGYVLNYKLLFNYINEHDIPVVWTFHDCWAFTGHCAHFVTANCDRWKTECYDCPLKREYPASVLFDNSRSNYRLKKKLFSLCKNLTIVPVSYWMSDFVRQSFLKEKDIEVIHNGIDLNIFRPQPNSKANNKKFQVLAVSNVWNKDKGLYDIIHLRKLLSEEYHIVVVGVSAEQVTMFPKGITAIQRTQNVEELVELYSVSDVFINPTYADTFPTVNLEALACGTPIITYNTGGSPEAIDENTGIVVAQGDVKGLADAICKIKETPLSSEACRKRAEDYFDKDKCYNKYIELYNRLLNN